MNDVPKFSIIVPIYKTEKYLRQCIESVLSQRCDDYELILVDDGSPDNSGEIADEYANNSDRIKVIHKPNGGLVSARKAGAREANGMYVLCLDSDDYLAENALSILSDNIDKTHSDMYSFGHEEYDEKRNTIERKYPSLSEGVYDNEESLKKIYKKVIYDKKKPFFNFGLMPSIWSKAIKREIYTKWQLQADERIIIGEDFALSVPMIFEVKSICIMHEALYCYRIIESSLSHAHTERKITNASAIITMFSELDLLKKRDVDLKGQLGAYSMAVVMIYLLPLLKTCKSLDEFKGYVKNIEGSAVLEAASDYTQRFRPIAYGVVTFLIKHRCWRLLWFIVRKRRG